MIIWGGVSYPSRREDEPEGAAYNPVTGRWRTLPSAPIEGRRAAASAYTGTELLIWGGLGWDEQTLGDGAAYDPATDTWRLLASSPLPSSAGMVGGWTGDEWLLVEAGTELAPEQASGRGAAYDPSSDRWRSISRLHLPEGWASTAAWTGEILVVVRVGSSGATAGAGYDAATGQWKAIPAYEGLTLETFPHAIWTGAAAALVRGPIQTSVGATEPSAVLWYDLARDAWRRTPGPPRLVPAQAPVWTGTHVFLYGGGSTPSLTLDVADDTWTEFAVEGDRRREFWSTVWTGTNLLVWGGTDPESATPRPDGVVIWVPQ